VQTCGQVAAHALQECQGLPKIAVCEQVTEQNRLNCLVTGTWERKTAKGKKTGPDLTGLRKE
jgi:hypothetical protein